MNANCLIVVTNNNKIIILLQSKENILIAGEQSKTLTNSMKEFGARPGWEANNHPFDDARGPCSDGRTSS